METVVLRDKNAIVSLTIFCGKDTTTEYSSTFFVKDFTDLKNILWQFEKELFRLYRKSKAKK